MIQTRSNANRIKIRDLADQIIKELEEYGTYTTDTVKKAVDKVTKETIEDIKAEAPTRGGSYKAEWRSKSEGAGLKAQKIIYNKKRYQLAHLLEKGHARRGGGRKVPGKAHIEPAEKKVVERVMEELRREL